MGVTHIIKNKKTNKQTTNNKVDVPKLLVNGGEVVRVLLFYGRVGVPYFSSTYVDLARTVR